MDERCPRCGDPGMPSSDGYHLCHDCLCQVGRPHVPGLTICDGCGDNWIVPRGTETMCYWCVRFDDEIRLLYVN